MAGNKTENEKPPVIVIKRIKKGGGGHHGGAWKVAYADFVTAMMAFFLLLWLLNVTTQEQKNAISNYFDPSHPKVSNVMSGAGGLLGGMTMSPEGAIVSTTQPLVQPEQPDTTTRGALEIDGDPHDIDKLSEKQLEEELRKKEDERFKAASDKLKADLASSPDLKDLLNNLLIDITPEGLRIQIVDDKGRSMFPSGSAAMYDFMRQLLLKVTSAVLPLPNQVSVRGHTDSVKYKEPNSYDNWNLSADRAQASRRVMVQGGLPEKRIENVMGRADREHLMPKEPANPRNRRITIILLRDRVAQAARPVPAKAATPAATKDQTQQPAKEGKLPGIQIIDDTKPVPKVVAGGSQAEGTGPGTPANADTKATTGANGVPVQGAGEQELPPGYVPLPVTPGGTRAPAGQRSMTFGETPAKATDLYDGPVESPYVNKPPTIRTPVFNLDGDTPPTPAPSAPVLPQKALTFGEAPAPVAQPSAPATAAPQTLIIAPADNSGDAPALQLIQPQPNAKTLTFGDTQEPVPAPAESQPAVTTSPDGKVLTFD